MFHFNPIHIPTPVTLIPLCVVWLISYVRCRAAR